MTGASLDPQSGLFIVPASTLSGVYSISYEICERVNMNNCSLANITVMVHITPILAVSDTGTFIIADTGSLELLSNDTYS